MAMDPALRPAACAIAARLRGAGRRVDLVLEDKRMKWAFKVGGGGAVVGQLQQHI